MTIAHQGPALDVPEGARAEVIDDLRVALGELLGAERRLRGRDRQNTETCLTHAQVRALVALREKTEVTAGALAKAADLNPASVTAMLDHLEERGIVARRRDVEDRRRVVVSLTAEGRRLMVEGRARWQGKLDAALRELDDEDVASAARVMRSLGVLYDSL
jgi:DNA-binding MarR family transcriptional regulator